MTKFQKSNLLIDKALKAIPLGSQTFSKSITQYPKGVSPLFIKKGQGSQVWDVDDNQFTDFVCGLASIGLGYQDLDVLQAVKDQLELGTIFSLPGELEVDVANLIIQTIPSIEMVRFGKNGSDVTSAAIRIARAYTQKDLIAVCGYHGWHDWYIGSTTRNLGIPKQVCDLTHKFQYNNIESLNTLLNAHKNEFACVIMEAMNVVEPADDFLHKVQSLAKEHGCLFILDEIVTGFRFGIDGAQGLFKLDPDLTTFGKGMANGYPISCIGGKTKYMKVCEDIFFSGTFGGELLSLAATKATINKIKSENTTAHTNQIGGKIKAGIKEITQNSDIFNQSGHNTWLFLNVNNCKNYNSFEIKTLLLQELFKRGILFIGTHNICYSHSDEDVQNLLSVYSEVLPFIEDVVKRGELNKYLETSPLVPLFKVR